MARQEFMMDGKPYPEMERKEEFDYVSGKYPDYPHSFLIKTDCVRRGVTFTKEAITELQDLSYEHTAQLLFQFHSFDHAAFEVPFVFVLSDGTHVGIRLSPPEFEPYTIDFKDGKFFLFSNPDDEPLEEINFYRRPEWYDKMTSTGYPMQFILQRSVLDCGCNVTMAHCHYWNKGEQCKFCDIDHNTKVQLKRGHKFRTRCKPQELYEACCEWLKNSSPGENRHIFVNGGSDPRNDYEFDYELNVAFIEAANKAGRDTIGEDFVVPILLIANPFKEEHMIGLKEAGLSGYGIYLEIWDPDKFAAICPGKNRLGRDTWMKRMVKAVEIFGESHVNCAFVAGAEMSPAPYGFSDIDEAVNSTLEGARWCADHGVVPTATNWFIEPGSVFYDLGAVEPPLEYYARMDLGRYAILKGAGLSCDSLGWKSQPWSCYPDFQRLL